MDEDVCRGIRKVLFKLTTEFLRRISHLKHQSLVDALKAPMTSCRRRKIEGRADLDVTSVNGRVKHLEGTEPADQPA